MILIHSTTPTGRRLNGVCDSRLAQLVGSATGIRWVVEAREPGGAEENRTPDPLLAKAQRGWFGRCCVGVERAEVGVCEVGACWRRSAVVATGVAPGKLGKPSQGRGLVGISTAFGPV